MNPNIESLITVANTHGKNPAYIQGGGGNISQKISEEVMLVKASGFRLDDITAERGLVPVRYDTLRHYYATTPSHQSLADAIVNNDKAVAAATLDTTFRPSIETGFHAILGTTVLHTHAVYANLFTCSHEGKDCIARLFPESVYIPYYTPGIALTNAIAQAIQETPRQLLFLENHGIITVGDDANSASQLHEKTIATIKSHLHLDHYYPTPLITTAAEGEFQFSLHTNNSLLCDAAEFLHTLGHTIIFPDQAVYTNHINLDIRTDAPLLYHSSSRHFTAFGSYGFALAAAETLQAWIYLYDTITAQHLTLRTLAVAEGQFIANLDSEKYRKKIA